MHSARLRFQRDCLPSCSLITFQHNFCIEHALCAACLASHSRIGPSCMSGRCRDERTGKPRTVSTLLRTSGGDCSQSVGNTMGQLFAGVGSPSLFYWDKGMWQLSQLPAGTTRLYYWLTSTSLLSCCNIFEGLSCTIA